MYFEQLHPDVYLLLVAEDTIPANHTYNAATQQLVIWTTLSLPDTAKAIQLAQGKWEMNNC